MARKYEDEIFQLKMERDSAFQVSIHSLHSLETAMKKVEQEIAHSIALHKDALLQKEKQYSDALETQKRLHQEELSRVSKMNENK